MQRNILKYLAVALVCLSGMSCKQLIYDDLSDCPQYLAVRLIAPKDCVPFSSDTDFGKVEVCTYELDGSLVDRTFLDKLPEYGDSTIMVTVPKPASYRIVVKASKDLSEYYIDSDKESEKKNIFSYKDETIGRELSRLLFGTNIALKEFLTNDGTTVDTVTVQMRTMTNRLNLKISGLDEGQDYFAEVKADNRAYDNTGSSTKTTAVYQRDLKRSGELNLTTVDILSLSGETSGTLSIKDKQTGETVFEVPLVSLLTQIVEASGKTVNFNCRHSYDIDLNIELDATNMRFTVTILPWNLIMRDVTFKGI